MSRPIVSEYLVRPLRPQVFKRIVEGTAWLVRKAQAKKWVPAFDSVAFSGNSGVMVGPAIAARLNRGMLLVRKHTECHSSYRVEGVTDVQKYIIVDDFLSSGKTVNRIMEEIEKWWKDKCSPAPNLVAPKCVGIFCYNDHGRFGNDCTENEEWDFNYFGRGKIFTTGLSEDAVDGKVKFVLRRKRKA